MQKFWKTTLFGFYVSLGILMYLTLKPIGGSQTVGDPVAVLNIMKFTTEKVDILRVKQEHNDVVSQVVRGISSGGEIAVVNQSVAQPYKEPASVSEREHTGNDCQFNTEYYSLGSQTVIMLKSGGKVILLESYTSIDPYEPKLVNISSSVVCPEDLDSTKLIIFSEIDKTPPILVATSISTLQQTRYE